MTTGVSLEMAFYGTSGGVDYRAYYIERDKETMSRYYCDHCDTVKYKDYSPCSEYTDSEGHTSLVCEECFYAHWMRLGNREKFETEIIAEILDEVTRETRYV